MSSLDVSSAKRYPQAMIRLVTMLLVSSSLALQARIDETVKECEARYGPVVEHIKPTQKESDKEACTFSKNSVTVIAEYREGKAWRITYNKIGMEPSEVDTILAANSSGGSWSPPLKISGQEIRTTADHKRMAIFTPGKHPEATFTLVIATTTYATAHRADYESRLATIPDLLKRRNTDKLKGF
ncbi:MAG: hypothetical protein JWO89_416 [Verrucomicrobiaceae bacterium]|nr:hypothetical protein [Verrucomicrobiaceae bacterium]MDB6118092.1 hypothetical protein [Verrucomicrobiaceae bacterium]